MKQRNPILWLAAISLVAVCFIAYLRVQRVASMQPPPVQLGTNELVSKQKTESTPSAPQPTNALELGADTGNLHQLLITNEQGGLEGTSP